MTSAYSRPSSSAGAGVRLRVVRDEPRADTDCTQHRANPDVSPPACSWPCSPGRGGPAERTMYTLVRPPALRVRDRSPRRPPISAGAPTTSRSIKVSEPAPGRDRRKHPIAPARLWRQYKFHPLPRRFHPRHLRLALQTRCDLSQAGAEELYRAYYADAPFTHVSERGIDLKQVVNTNKCLIHVGKTRRQPAGDGSHRQPAQRGERPGGTEYEPDGGHRRNGGPAAQTIGVLTH